MPPHQHAVRAHQRLAVAQTPAVPQGAGEVVSTEDASQRRMQRRGQTGWTRLQPGHQRRQAVRRVSRPCFTGTGLDQSQRGWQLIAAVIGDRLHLPRLQACPKRHLESRLPTRHDPQTIEQPRRRGQAACLEPGIEPSALLTAQRIQRFGAGLGGSEVTSQLRQLVAQHGQLWLACADLALQ